MKGAERKYISRIADKFKKSQKTKKSDEISPTMHLLPKNSVLLKNARKKAGVGTYTNISRAKAAALRPATLPVTKAEVML